MIKHRVRTVVLSAVAAGAVLFSAGTAGATELKEILDVGVSNNKMAQESQKRIDKTVDQIDGLVSKYKSVLKTIEGLRIYNAQLQRQIDLQNREMADLSDSIKRVTYVKRQITPLMIRMVNALEVFINMDLPFKKAERLAGIERLKELMDNPSVDASEKFRSVFEAYQIESDYGRIPEAYSDKVNVNGNDLEVDVLHIGRVALVYQTRDGKISGMWDKEIKDWVVLDDSYRKSINVALKVAKKQAAADKLLRLPIDAPLAGNLEAAQ